MKYLHKFSSLADFEAAYNGSDYHEPWVSTTPVNESLRVDYNKHITNADFDLVVDYAQGENNFYAIVQSKEDIHILNKESDGYGYIIDDNSSLLPPLQLNEGDVINVRVLNYNGKTVDLQVPFLDNGEYVADFFYTIENEYIAVYVQMKDSETTQENKISVYIGSENPFT